MINKCFDHVPPKIIQMQPHTFTRTGCAANACGQCCGIPESDARTHFHSFCNNQRALCSHLGSRFRSGWPRREKIIRARTIMNVCAQSKLLLLSSSFRNYPNDFLLQENVFRFNGYFIIRPDLYPFNKLKANVRVLANVLERHNY